MQKLYIFFCLVFMARLATAQQSELVDAFTPLVGHTWVSDTILADQSKFKQHCTFEFDLDKKLVLVSSDGFTDRKQTKWGKRNHGIRYLDPKTKQLNFIEYDVFGGATRGRIFLEADNIYYTYAHGREVLTDAWIKQSDDHYHFKVGVRDNGSWEKVYIESDFRRKATEANPSYRSLDFWLGHWEVYDNKTEQLVGHSQVSSIIDGMGIQEKSHSADGKFHGVGISKYNPETLRWNQMWVDNAGTTILLEGKVEKGEIVFTNEELKDGVKYKNKVNWKKQGDGSIRQIWNTTEAGKDDWKVNYDLTYRRSEK